MIIPIVTGALLFTERQEDNHKQAVVIEPMVSREVQARDYFTLFLVEGTEQLKREAADREARFKLFLEWSSKRDSESVIAQQQERYRKPVVQRPAVVAAEDIRGIVCSYGWECEGALRVVYGGGTCPNGESGGNPTAYNNGNYGIFQINAIHIDKVQRVTGVRDLNLLFDPKVNAAVAWIIFSDSGWGPWSCRP